MYSSGYSQVSKSSPQAMKKKQYRSKGKSCGYYMRIVFFFSSLIQSLIIVSLVLFLVYGKSQDSASTSRIQDLEESFSRLSIENVALRQQRKNLTNFLNATLIEKARNDWDLANLRYFSNISALLIQDMDKKQQQCNRELFFCKGTAQLPTRQIQCNSNCDCGLLGEQMRARLTLVESNFTQTTQKMRIEMDQTAKERDNINLEVIRLRRDKFTHEKEVEFFRQKCKDDFAQSLSGISNVSKAFLDKISTLFHLNTFQISCSKVKEHLDEIRTNCTSLSLEVEDRFQRYLNNVGQQVTNIQGENSRLKAENLRLSEDYRWCSTNRTGLILQNRQNLDKLQRNHDEEKERLLMDKLKLNGDIEVLNNHVKYKSRMVDHLAEQIKQLNMSCMVKPGFGVFPSRAGTQPQSGFGLFGGGSSSASASSSGFGQLGRTGTSGLNLGSFGSGINKPASTGFGSLNPSLGSSNPFGSAFNNPASTGFGSSSSSRGSGISFGSAFNKPASTGTGSSSSSASSSGSGSSFGTAFNKPASTGTGSSSSSASSSGSGSSFGSAFNKPASTGTGSSSSSASSSGSGSSFGSAFNKPASTGTGSSSSSASSSGSGSSFGSAFNKPASTGTGSSSSSASSSGSGSSFGSAFNKPASTGTGSSSSSASSSGSGSSFGSAFSKPASTGTGSSSSSASSSGSGSSTASKPSSGGGFFSSFGSSGTGSSKSSSSGSTSNSNPSSSGTGSNKPTTSAKSSGSSWFGFGSSSSSSQSKTGSGTGKGPSPGNSFGGTGPLFGAGRTNGQGGGPNGLGGGPNGLGGGSSGLGGGSSINVAQHIRDLQRFINPSGPEEKQDLSRMLG